MSTSGRIRPSRLGIHQARLPSSTITAGTTVMRITNASTRTPKASDRPIDFVIGLVFVAVETLVVVGATISLTFLIKLTNRTPDADRNEPWLMAQPRPPLVDVFICTYNEEEAILEQTILGAMAMQHPNYRVWVCDDGRRPWLEELCTRLGCGYLKRSDNAHAKAGNINDALQVLSQLPDPPEFISILDADFVPTPQTFQLRRYSLVIGSPQVAKK